jgi:hypothetical protein
MTRTSTQFIIALLLFIISIFPTIACIHQNEMAQQQPNVVATVDHDGQELRLSIPGALWEPVFFKSLETHLKKISMPTLRTLQLPNKDDLEVRFWIDVLPSKLDGIILRRISNKWSAVGIHGTAEHRNFPITQEDLAVPKSGWTEAWEKLVSAGILTLPDASKVNCNATAIDGIAFVVEINSNRSYRTYAYGNPQLAECDEAKRIIHIRQILFDEFEM